VSKRSGANFVCPVTRKDIIAWVGGQYRRIFGSRLAVLARL